jgi:Inositol polyphosphate kinase
MQVSPEEAAQAITSREGIRVGSASGASALGAALALCGAGDAMLGWMRIGTNTIRKRSNTVEANFYQSIAASGHLAPHLPVIYSISNLPREEVHILMGDLVTGMRHPCAMSFLMGVRTVTHADLDPTHGTPHVALCDSMRSMAPEYAARMLSPDEARSGAVPLHRYLEFLDSISTSRSLGFRIDAAKTVVDGTLDGTLDPLRSAAASTLNTASDETQSAQAISDETQSAQAISDETQSAQAISDFLQRDARLAGSTLLKLRTLKKALSRSSFFGRHAFVRSAMLL